MKIWAQTAIIGSLGLIAACSVNGGDNSVIVKHSAEQEIVGRWAAESHCAKTGKVPKLLKISPAISEPSTLFFRTKTSVYECIEADEK